MSYRKIVLITGVSRGIGKAVAIIFAKNGYNVAINYSNHYEEALKVKKIIKGLNSESILIKADVSKISNLKRVVDMTLKKFRKIDVLVNNAGIKVDNSFFGSDELSWSKTINTDLKSVYFLTKFVGSHMKKNKSGNIINIASQAGAAAISSSIEYGLAKNGIMYLTKSLAKILAPNINVNCVSPGRTDTDMVDYRNNPGKRVEHEKNIPLKRINKPEDIANLVFFLASNESRNITGQVIAVDGGENL